MKNALAYTLLHFLWEGAVIALPLAVCRASSRTRYLVACCVFFAMPVAFCVTLALMMPGNIPRSFAPVVSPPTLGTGSASAGGAQQFPGLSMEWFVPIWLTGVCIFSLRSLGSCIVAQRIRRSASETVPGWWTERLQTLAGAMGVTTAVRLLESCKVDVPVVIGFLRPVILFPAGLLTGLSADQAEFLLIHELAHIRRFDYLVNLLQTIVEGILFYHPAVWWVSGAMRAERENCCDDAVLAMGSDAHHYATTLAGLERSRFVLSQAASGGSLVNRIRRVLYGHEGPRFAGVPLAIALVTLSAAFAVAELPKPVPAAMAHKFNAPAVPAVRLVAQVAPAPQRPSGAVALPESPWQKWVIEDVAYIITDEERRAFRNLTSDDEREQFVEQFWQRRDPTPDTPENEFRTEHYRRIAYANQHYTASVPGWKTDRGRIYITFGPPDEIDSHPACGSQPEGSLEDWRYHYIAGVGNEVNIRFSNADCLGEYRMTMDPSAVK